MPQIGHEPGLSRTIWGCIGHVYSVLVAGAAATTGSSAMPHFGQSPGPSWRTSGSIGQVYSFEACRGDAGGGGGAIDVNCGGAECDGGGATGIVCKGAGAMPSNFLDDKYFACSALNFSWQPR